MKKILLTLLVLTGITATAQVKVGDNPTTINADALLEMESTNKGLLLPRVALTATNNPAPLTAHVAGMKVYNTATAGTAPNNVVPGVYYNDGAKWVKVAPAAQVFKPAKNVYVDVADPNSATKWGEVRYLNYDATTSGCIVNTGFVDDPTLAANTTYMYIGQTTCDENSDAAEFSYWIYDGSAYVPFTSADESTAWYLENTTVDAGSNKESIIRRPGTVIIGQGAVFTKDYKFYSNFNTELDAYASANSNKSLYASVNAMMNRGANPQTQITASYDINYNYSAGALTSQYGSCTNTRNFGGNIGTIFGNYVYTLNDATATGNVTSMYGLPVTTLQNAAGTMTNFRGITNTTTIGDTAGVPTNSYGYVSAITNSSNKPAPAGTTNFAGFQSGVTNNGVAKFTNMYGGYLSITNGVNAGAPTNVYLLRNDFTNSATTTDAMGAIRGYTSTISNNGNSNVAEQRGIVVSNSTGTSATNGIPAVMEGINLNTQLRTQQAGTSTGLHGISNAVTHSSAVNTTASYGYSGSQNINSSGVVTTLRGFSTSINNATTGAGNTALSGYYTTITHSSATNTAAILGDYISTSNSGKLSSHFNTQYSFTNSSTQGNTITTLHGLYSLLNTTSASNDNVTNSSGLYIANTFASTGAVTANFSGAQILATNSSTGAGTLALQQGLYVNNILNTTAANVTNNYGSYIYNNVNDNFGGVLTNNYGLRIQNRMAGTGTITNSYSLFIDNMTATNVTGQNWSIFSANSAPSNLAGSLRFSANDSNGSNHIYTSEGYMNIGATRSGAMVYLGRGLKADPVNANLYVSNVAQNVSRTAIELQSGVIRFIGQSAAENVAVDGAITAPVEVMRINSLTQRVGIGTNSPLTKFAVEGVSDISFNNTSFPSLITPETVLTVKNNNTTAATNPFAAIQLTTMTGGTNRLVYIAGVAQAATGYATDLVFGYRNGPSTGVENMRLLANGNLGIGTTTPAERLEVNGAIKIGTRADAGATVGTIRFNTTTNKFQGQIGVGQPGADANGWVDLHP